MFEVMMDLLLALFIPAAFASAIFTERAQKRLNPKQGEVHDTE